MSKEEILEMLRSELRVEISSDEDAVCLAGVGLVKVTKVTTKLFLGEDEISSSETVI